MKRKMITDKQDLLREAKDCVKDVIGGITDYGYVLPDLIEVVIESEILDKEKKEVIETLQDEIDSWGNLPLEVKNIIGKRVLIYVKGV